MNVSKNKRVTCLADIRTDYIIEDHVIEKIMLKDNVTKEEAIDQAISIGECEEYDYNVYIVDTVMVHESNVQF